MLSTAMVLDQHQTHSLSTNHDHPHRIPPSIQHHQHHPFSYNHQSDYNMQHDSIGHSHDSAIPSLLPPGVDPATVDFRTFYPYIPNEVKHRKRTSRAQLKVLEDVFRKDTKPNGALRKKLAKQLDMTARGVQVWFQNRRAKEKTQAKKRLLLQQPLVPAGSNPEMPDDDKTKAESEAQTTSSNASRTPEPYQADFSDDSTLEAHKHTTPSCHLSNASWRHSPNASPTDPTSGQPPFDGMPDSQLLSLRRGSLPVIPQTTTYPMNGSQPFKQATLCRRRSIDASVYRLASHPYAHLAVAKNNAIYGPNIVRSPSQLRLSAQMPTQHPSMGGRGSNYSNNTSSQHCPNLVHRASLPHAHTSSTRGIRYPNPASSASPSPSPLSFPSTRTGPQDARFFPNPSRLVSSPIPGPLPSPDFSFGAPVSTPECDSPETQGQMFPAYGGFGESDVDDGASSASYFSRFGSISSMAGSETSNNSSLYSEGAQAGFQAEVRRPSCSNHMMEMMNGLEVNTGPFSSHDNMGGTSDAGSHHSGTNPYPSPTSTVSDPALPISRSSELVYALRDSEEQRQAQADEQQMDVSHPHMQSHSGESSSTATAYFFPQIQQEPAYAASAYTPDVTATAVAAASVEYARCAQAGDMYAAYSNEAPPGAHSHEPFASYA